MQAIKIVFLLFAFVLFTAEAAAPKLFSEGIIKYDVYINASTKPDGIYVVSVKGSQIKRELAMNSGYNNVTIYNSKTGNMLSLDMSNDMKYALEMSPEEIKEKNKRFEGAVITPLDDTKKIAGYRCVSSKVTYTNSASATFYYTTELLPQNENINTMFPSLQGIPLEYEIKNANSINMRFVATVVDIQSVESAVFAIPADYKIVSKAELEKIK
jgi:hypothetical protein